MLLFIRACDFCIKILLFTVIWGVYPFWIQRRVCVYHLCHPDYLYATTHCILKNFVPEFYRCRFLVIGCYRKEILILNITIYMETIVVGAVELVLMVRYMYLFIFHSCILTHCGPVTQICVLRFCITTVKDR
jgi:hypothetical protein